MNNWYYQQHGVKSTKTTTVREYNEQGQCTKETVTVEETFPAYTYQPYWYSTSSVTPCITYTGKNTNGFTTS